MGHPKHPPAEITLLASSGPLMTKQYVRLTPPSPAAEPQGYSNHP